MTTLPRKLHFFWMGGEIPGVFKMLLERWRSFHPGWEFKVWGYDEVHALITQMGTGLVPLFENQEITLSSKSDVARYHIIQKHGGIYLDTDFVVLRPLDPLLQYRTFGVLEVPERVCAGVFGSVPGVKFLDAAFDGMRHQTNMKQSPSSLAGPKFFSPLIRSEIENDPDCAILPSYTFLPVRYGHDNYAAVDLGNSYAVHIWAHSWNDKGAFSYDELFLRARAVLVNPSGQ